MGARNREFESNPLDQLKHRMAFDLALERICTTLCGGYFRDHAIDYWTEIKEFNEDIFNKFFNSKLWRDYNDSART